MEVQVQLCTGVLVHQGLIDAGFSDNLKIILTNLTGDRTFINKVNAVAQLIILSVKSPTIVPGTPLQTDHHGFGSTSKRGFHDSTRMVTK